MNTYKLTIRKNAISPKYKALFAVNALHSGIRLDLPYISVAKFKIAKTVYSPHPMAKVSYTLKNKNSGIKFIYENNRTKKTKVYRITKINK